VLLSRTASTCRIWSGLCARIAQSSGTDCSMKFHAKLCQAWRQQRSFLCVGLDPDMSRLPEVFQREDKPYWKFCREVVDATAPYACAFKPQFAHFAAVGAEDQLAELIQYIKTSYPDHIVILDAKRGDVGSTAAFYAQEAYQRYDADAVTLSPYLGFDSVEPYLRYDDRGVIVVCRTSNAHSDWLQKSQFSDGRPVFLQVAETVAQWNTNDQCMLVAGATYPEELGQIRNVVADMPLLVPGIGAQGGDLQAAVCNGANSVKEGLLISSSRGIIYADSSAQFAQAAAVAAEKLRDDINQYM